MIILDLSQVMLSNLMMQIGNHTNSSIEESMVRHMVLNSIRSYKIKFEEEYGELIIACDNKNYWRKKIFPYYKANRKKNIENSELNWKEIFECMNAIRAELKEFFPYRIIDVESTEADDIIGTLCAEYGITEEYIIHDDYVMSKPIEKILILSGDKDFMQLQRFINVTQYDPVQKKYKKCDDPISFLKEHIIRGDSGDGIPNFLSTDNCLVIGDRQKPIMNKKLAEWIKQDPKQFCNESMLRNYNRNEQLIDLMKIPTSVYAQILEAYHNQANKKRGDLLNYFMIHKLKNLTENIGDFV